MLQYSDNNSSNVMHVYTNSPVQIPFSKPCDDNISKSSDYDAYYIISFSLLMNTGIR